jgi:hypothetical protein
MGKVEQLGLRCLEMSKCRLTVKYTKKSGAYSILYDGKPFMVFYSQDEYATYDKSTLAYNDINGVYQTINVKIPKGEN